MKKLLFIIPVLAFVLITSSCSNKAKYSPASANAIGKMFAQGDTAHLEVATLKAKPRKHTYKVCGTDSTYKTVQRFDAVPDTFKMDYVVQGAEINIDSALAAQGLKIVSINTPTTDQQQTATTASVTPDPQPVVQPEPETPTQPLDLTRLWDFIRILGYLLLAAIILIGGYKLLRYLGAIPVGNNGGGGGGGGQHIVQQTDTDSHRNPVGVRNRDNGKYTGGPGVKKTVIESKITHYYDDNRA
jgi:hypothetical protein